VGPEMGITILILGRITSYSRRLISRIVPYGDKGALKRGIHYVRTCGH